MRLRGNLGRKGLLERIIGRGSRRMGMNKREFNKRGRIFIIYSIISYEVFIKEWLGFNRM